MKCPECGSPIREGARCPACQNPEVGRPRRAPRGSDAPSDEPSTPTGWNTAFWVALALVFLVSLVLVLTG